jgi:hypothetical protein
LGPDPASWPERLDLALAASTPIVVRVVDELNKAQSDATVRQEWAGTEGEQSSKPVIAQLLASESVSDSSGEVRLSALPGTQVIWAEKGDLVSMPWRGSGPASVILQLGTSFTISGTITGGLTAAVEASDLNLAIDGWQRSIRRPLIRLRGCEFGAWGPLRLPRSRLEQFTVRLEGLSTLPQEETFRTPPAFTHKRIDFTIQRGTDLHLSVRDEHDRPISAAKAIAWWDTDMPLGPTRAEAAAGPDGEIHIGSVPAGWVQFRVTAPGYSLLELAMPTPGSYPVTLEKGGRVIGTCMHEGTPVKDFEVLFWQKDTIRRTRNLHFVDREDGSFEIDNLPPGEWAIHAASTSCPPGLPTLVAVVVDEVSRIRLELPDAISGAGRILDAETSQPVPGATVQPYSSGGMERSLPWGLPVQAALDGTFQMDAFVLGSNYLTVEAEGYARAEASTEATSTDFLDWGDIRLFRAQPLQVSLLGLSDLDHGLPSDFGLVGEYEPFLPRVAFDAEGIARFERAAPGDHKLFVWSPDDSWTRLHLRLDPGSPWDFDLKVSGERTLDVQVIGDSESLDYDPEVIVAATEDNGILVVRSKITDSSWRARFEGIRASKAQLFVLSADGAMLSAQDVDLAKAATQVEVSIEEEPFRVHVVDRDDRPVQGATVTVRSVEGSDVYSVDDTDARGWASLRGVPEAAVLLDIQHGVEGVRFGVAVDAAVRSTDVVLQAQGQIELHVLDGDVPLAGVAARMETPAGVSLSKAQVADEHGVLRFSSLGEGRYRFSCRRADAWPAFVETDLDNGEQARLFVQMRRLASATLRVCNRDGLPLADVPISIVSSEFDTPLQTWLADERIHSSSALVSGVRGELRLEGLPSGPYSWTVQLEGLPVGGAFVLAPGNDNAVLIQLP